MVGVGQGHGMGGMEYIPVPATLSAAPSAFMQLPRMIVVRSPSRSRLRALSTKHRMYTNMAPMERVFTQKLEIP